MKKHKLLILSSLVAMLALLLFAGCKKEAPSVAQVSNDASAMNDAPEMPDDLEVELFTMYANASAQGYKALAGKAKVVKTNMQGPNAVTARVVLENNIKLVLQKVEYDEATNGFKPVATIFSIDGKKGDVYEFDAIFSEGMPQAQLYAEGKYLSKAYHLQESGVDGLPNGVLVKGEQ